MAYMTQQILFIVFLLPVNGQNCYLPRNRSNCEECAAEGLDLSTGCTTCVSPLSIECEEGEQNCAVGNFVFSALFHSYQNPTHMCAECSDSGPVTCESVGRGLNCGLRFIYCLQPYGSQSFDPPLIVQSRFGDGTDNETFVGDFFTQNNTGSATPNLWNRSNPFTQKLKFWPGRLQFAIAVYNTPKGTIEFKLVDKMLIDLELNLSSNFTERRTYSGVNNISHFDMSFRMDCGENYYGSHCNKFYSSEGELSTCDNKVCTSKNSSMQTNCTVATTTDNTVPTHTSSTNTSSSIPSQVPNWTWGLVGGLIGVVTLLLLVVLVAVLCSRKRKATTATAANSYEIQEPIEDSTNIALHTNIGYRVNTERLKSSPQLPRASEESYAYISPSQIE